MAENKEVENKEAENEETDETGVKQNPAIEQAINRYIGNTILLFLSALSIVMLVAAAITAYDTIVREFPKLWQPTDEYSALQGIIQNVLLVGIAAELGLLLLFHRTSAAVEVVIFIIARKMVSPDISAFDLLMGATALSGLIVIRFYYLPGDPK